MKTTRHPILWVLVLASILLSMPASAQKASPTYAIWGDPEHGRKVYIEKGCGTCHSINGAGPKIGPDLGTSREKPQTITQIAGTMWNHAPDMRKLADAKGLRWESFQESEMRDLIAFLYFLRMQDRSGDIRRGQRLFDEKHCSTCHAIGGQGSRIGPDLNQWRASGSPIRWAEIMWRHAIQMEAKMREMGLDWPQFQDNEIVDLIAFIQSQGGQGTGANPKSP